MQLLHAVANGWQWGLGAQAERPQCQTMSRQAVAALEQSTGTMIPRPELLRSKK